MVNNFRSQKSPIPSKRIKNIIEYMSFEVFRYACRGFYESDKMTFTLLMALKIDLQCNQIKHEEFNTFIKGEFIFIHSMNISIFKFGIIVFLICKNFDLILRHSSHFTMFSLVIELQLLKQLSLDLYGTQKAA